MLILELKLGLNRFAKFIDIAKNRPLKLAFGYLKTLRLLNQDRKFMLVLAKKQTRNSIAKTR